MSALIIPVVIAGLWLFLGLLAIGVAIGSTRITRRTQKGDQA